MALQSPIRTTAFRLPDARSAYWPLAGIAIALALHFSVALGRAINWDEFWHYTQIYRLREGTLTQPLQSLYTRFFSWVPGLPGTGVDHIVVIRIAMFGCLLAICASIYAMASRFAERGIALLCVLLYLTAGYVLHHATSFRFDPMAGALLMGSLAVMLRSRLNGWAILVAALLAATATVLTIKSVLYAPAFAGVAWLRWRDAGKPTAMLARLAALAVATLLFFGLIYYLHSHALGNAAAADANAKFNVENSAQKMFGFGNLPYYRVIPRAALLAPIFAICILMTPAILLRRRNLPAPERIALAGLWLPITVLAFYHNTAPYFYVFILPPVAVACAIVLPELTKRYSLAAISGALVVIAAGIWLVDDHSGTQDRQRELMKTADRIFPEPVGYFDLAGMLGHHHKMNPFMTPWGTENYLKGDVPSMRETMETTPVPLVMNNDPMFENALAGKADPHFLAQDAAALRDNYLPFWGPFWLAGKAVPAGAAETDMTFLVPGRYTVRDAAITVDGKSYALGDVLTLDRGAYRLRAAGGTDARLVWGDRLKTPSYLPPKPPYWTDF